MNGKYFTILFSYAGNCSDSVVITVNVVELLLLAAGDIEINPGPVHPGNVCVEIERRCQG